MWTQHLVCVFHTYPLMEQSYHTQTGALNCKQMTTSAFGINAHKCMYGSIWVPAHTNKSNHVCAATRSNMLITHILNTHTHTCTSTQAHIHTACLLLLPAFSLCMPTVCLAPGLRSGATHKLCALSGFYTL